jgi:translation initiation factor 2-alpha kinase 4
MLSARAHCPLTDCCCQGVGTPFYISPEQMRYAGSYNRKVDMYALGIMLFEMVFPIATAMERHKVLGALRETCAFPPEFEALHPTEAAVVRWLLNHDPKKRPSARQLLESDLLPSNLDQEIVKEALRTIHPDSTIYGDLMRRLFAREPDSRVDYTYDFNSADQPVVSDVILSTMHVTDLAADVARKRGALRVDSTLLMPKRSTLVDVASCAQLLDESGLPVTLPFDLTVPFARFVAHNKVTQLRRFSVGRVFRR